MEFLRKRLEQHQYNTMIQGIIPPKSSALFAPDDEEYSAADAKRTKNQLSAVINILLSMVSVFVAIFVWMRNSPDYLVTQTPPPIPGLPLSQILLFLVHFPRISWGLFCFWAGSLGGLLMIARAMEFVLCNGGRRERSRIILSTLVECREKSEDRGNSETGEESCAKGGYEG